jgi:hypothetical protein
VVLAGAGISVEEPSGIPAAWGLSDALLKWIAPNQRRRLELAQRMTPGNHFNPYHFLRFEGLVQAIAAIDPNIFYYLESTQAYGQPNINHQLLMRMALKGTTILTANFYTRIEQAAREKTLPTFVLSSNRRMPNTSDRLIKLHGSFPWRRGRNVTPHATLTQIGKLGLGFARFPEFRDWFRAITTGKHFVVIGYSASDSFDVVPLIENETRAKTVTWLSYQPNLRRVRTRRIPDAGVQTPFPAKRTIEFAANTLQRLATQCGSSCDVCLVEASSVQSFLQATVNLPRVTTTSSLDGPATGTRNLKLLRQTLLENPLDALQRRVILGMINDGLFGEAYATDVEARHVRRGKKVVFVESKVRFNRGTAEYRADIAFKRGQPDLAMKILEDSARKSADADQLLLLLHHFEFRFGEQQADLQRLDRAISKSERVSKRTGLLWGLIMTEWMKSFRLEAAAKRSVRSSQTAHEQAQRILSHAQRTVYYGVRAGWQSWYATSARLAAKHAVAIRDFDTAESLLTNLLEWLDRETVEGIQETAGTACALNTLGIHSKRPRLINIAQQILESLDVKICPVVKLLRVASMAELAHTKSDWRTVQKLERRANQLIMKVDPADHWNVRGVFEYLRLAASPRKQYVSG